MYINVHFTSFVHFSPHTNHEEIVFQPPYFHPKIRNPEASASFHMWFLLLHFDCLHRNRQKAYTPKSTRHHRPHTIIQKCRMRAHQTDILVFVLSKASHKSQPEIKICATIYGPGSFCRRNSARSNYLVKHLVMTTILKT